ncbi:MAG: sulfur carrier protein ThiS [Myxococcota bacterium]|nr:sulfur carrier protein ThiS [Myxococcota bacterium]
MKILLNGESIEIAPNMTLTQLLALRGLSQSKGIAIACNEDVIHRTQWMHTTLQDGDRVEILQATAGG